MSTRTRYLVVILLGAAVLAVGLSTGATETLVVGTWGGVWETAFKEHIIPMFEASHDCKVVLDIGSSTARVAKIRAQLNDQLIDVAMLTPEALMSAVAEGLAEPFDLDVLTNWEEINSRFTEPFRRGDEYYGTAVSWVAMGILWREDLVPFEITSWKDLWHLSLKGKVSVQVMPNLGGASILIAAALMYGGDQYNIDPGFQAMKDLQPNLNSYYSLSSAVLGDLANGEIWACSNIVGQGVPYRDAGVRITLPAEGIPYSMQGMAIAKNTRNYQLALEFVNFMLSAEAQASWTSATMAAPTNDFLVLDPEVQSKLVERPETVDLLMDIDFLNMAEKMEEWTERWNREL